MVDEVELGNIRLGKHCAMENEVPDGLSVHQFASADEDVAHKEMTDKAIISNISEADDAKDQNIKRQTRGFGFRHKLFVFRQAR